MPITGGAWQVFYEFKKRLANKEIDLDSDTIKCALLKSTYTVDLANHKNWADISAQEVAAGNGYTAGGNALANASLTLSTGTLAWDTDNTTFTANGGTLTARYAAVYDDTHASKALIAVCLLDAGNNDVVAFDGVSIGITIANIFTLA